MARLCFLAFVALSSIALAAASTDFEIVGKVYCDTCRAGFETNVTEYIEGAKVRLECKHYINGKVEHSVDGVTDKTGTYKVKLAGNKEEDICEVALVESPIKDCNKFEQGRDRARIVLSDDTGISSSIRYANPLGYLKDVPLDVCAEIMKIYNLDEEE